VGVVGLGIGVVLTVAAVASGAAVRASLPVGVVTRPSEQGEDEHHGPRGRAVTAWIRGRSADVPSSVLDASLVPLRRRT
jgi:hypothetical protein